MAEEDKSTSAWYKVPTWDGCPATWRALQREMNWWLSSREVENAKKHNLAARWLLRQSGVVRQNSPLRTWSTRKRSEPETRNELTS